VSFGITLMAGWQNSRAKTSKKKGFYILMVLKKCTRCGIEKSEDQFPLRSSVAKGLVPRSYCVTCEETKPVKKRSAVDTKLNANNKRRYGVTPEDIQAAGEAQGWLCPISGTDISEKYYIDHDHVTGKFRQLLCFHCNLALGHFKDSPERLTKALEYLDKHSVKGVNMFRILVIDDTRTAVGMGCDELVEVEHSWDAVAELRAGHFDEIWFDFDLEGDDKGTNVARFIRDNKDTLDLRGTVCHIHSFNPGGRQSLKSILKDTGLPVVMNDLANFREKHKPSSFDL
jgi:hypothetical protein